MAPLRFSIPLRNSSIAGSDVTARVIAANEPSPWVRKMFVCATVSRAAPTASLEVAHQSWKTSASRSISWWRERTMRSNQ